MLLGDLADLMMGNTLMDKYSYLGGLIMKVQINVVSLSNALIYLVVSINVMANPTMERLGITYLRQTTTMMKLVE